MWLLVSSEPLISESGEKLGVVATFRNVTDVKEGEHKIEAAFSQLKEKATDLEKLNRLMVDRELKMIELKEEIVRLKNEKLPK